MPTNAKWTILTYIAAHNNLQYLGKRSYDQIVSVGSTPEVTHGILFDWPDGAARYIVGSPGKVIKQEQLGDYDCGDSGSLIKTAQWVFGQYPAEHYGLILWSHGSGWRPEEMEEIAKKTRYDDNVDAQETKDRSASPGSKAFFRSTLQTILKKENAAERAICFDDGTGHSLDTLELDLVTNKIANLIGQKLDLVGMDACLMANLEVAYQLRHNVAYMVASEELVPGHSWPYDLIYSIICANPSLTPNDFAVRIVQEYVDYYSKHALAIGDVTKIALNLSNISNLASSINGLAIALERAMNTQANLLWTIQRESEQKETRDDIRRPNKFQFHLWDIGSVAMRLKAKSDNLEVRSASHEVMLALKPGGPTVCAEGHIGVWFDGIGGISIYMLPPKKLQRMSPYYAMLSLSGDINWGKMLQAYYACFP